MIAPQKKLPNNKHARLIIQCICVITLGLFITSCNSNVSEEEVPTEPGIKYSADNLQTSVDDVNYLDQTILQKNQTLQTESFAITVTGMTISTTAGSGAAQQEAGPGNKYVILDVRYKNLSNESLRVTGDYLYATYRGKDYTFSTQEIILQNGYGTAEALNPLTTLTTKIVFKIPEEFTGKTYYKPASADDKHAFLVGIIE